MNIAQFLSLGWTQISAGRSKHIDYNEKCTLLIRTTQEHNASKEQTLLNKTDRFKKGAIKNIDNTSEKRTGAEKNMGARNCGLPLAPALNHIPSLVSLSSGEPCLCVGISVMRTIINDDSPVVICCCSCSVDSFTYDFAFVGSSNVLPSFDYVLGRIMDELYSRHPEAIPCPVYRYGEAAKGDLGLFPLTIVCHDALANLCVFTQLGRCNQSVIKHLTSVGKGAVSMFPIRISPISYTRPSGWFYNYHLSVSIRDTICCCPADACSISDMGKSIGIPYIEKPNIAGAENGGISAIIEKSCNGAIIPLLYSQSIYGNNITQPPTILTATARCIKKSIMEYLCIDDKHYNNVYRGYDTIKHGLNRTEDGSYNTLTIKRYGIIILANSLRGHPCFIPQKSLIP